MELEVAEFLVTLPAAAFIIDCNWNMDGTTIAQSVQPLVRYLRDNGHPKTPIVLAEGTESGSSWYSLTSRNSQQAKRDALAAGFANLTSAYFDDDNLYYVKGDQLFAADSEGAPMDPTVGGTHPTDEGMRQIADFYTDFLPPIVDGAEPCDGPCLPVNYTAAAAAASASASAAVPRATERKERKRGVAALSMAPPPRVVDDAFAFTLLSTLGVGGRAFDDTAAYFNRLPAAAEGVVTDAVWSLSKDSTGMFARFATDADSLALRRNLTNPCAPTWHMASASVCGVDLYGWDGNTTSWRHVAIFHAEAQSGDVLVSGLQSIVPGNRTYLLYLPDRNTVDDDAAIGVPAGAYISGGGGGEDDGAPTFAPNAIVWYGTSIQQAGAVSRPGTMYDFQLTRRLNREIFNFGFAGEGHMDLEVAEFLVQIQPAPAMFVIDCLPNMGAESVTAKTAPLVEFLRANGSDPQTPIVLVESTPHTDGWIYASTQQSVDAANAALREEFNALVAAGDANLYLVAGSGLFGDDDRVAADATVGGVHPSDMGEYLMGDFYAKFLPTLLP